MIDIQTVESIHNILIDKYGGSKGIRDIGALENRLNDAKLAPALTGFQDTCASKSPTFFSRKSLAVIL